MVTTLNNNVITILKKLNKGLEFRCSNHNEIIGIRSTVSGGYPNFTMLWCIYISHYSILLIFLTYMYIISKNDKNKLRNKPKLLDPSFL
jgi:hypothetical protein